LSDEQKQLVHEVAKVHCISYTFLHQSRAQHGNIKVDQKNDFTTGKVTDTPRTVSRLCTSSTSTARPLLCPKTTSAKGLSFTQKGSTDLALKLMSNQVKKSHIPDLELTQKLM
jgi:hypothetical protein